MRLYCVNLRLCYFVDIYIYIFVCVYIYVCTHTHTLINKKELIAAWLMVVVLFLLDRKASILFLVQDSCVVLNLTLFPKSSQAQAGTLQMGLVSVLNSSGHSVLDCI